MNNAVFVWWVTNKAPPRWRRRYQRNSQGTSILASHESEEQLRELIWDYEGHVCKSTLSFEHAEKSDTVTQSSRRADRRICGEPHGSTSKQIKERQIDKSTSSSKESRPCVYQTSRVIKACLGLSMATPNRSGKETTALRIEKRSLKEKDLFKEPICHLTIGYNVRGGTKQRGCQFSPHPQRNWDGMSKKPSGSLKGDGFFNPHESESQQPHSNTKPKTQSSGEKNKKQRKKN